MDENEGDYGTETLKLDYGTENVKIESRKISEILAWELNILWSKDIGKSFFFKFLNLVWVNYLPNDFSISGN